LIPEHQSNSIRSFKPKVDVFPDLTVLFIDVVGLTNLFFNLQPHEADKQAAELLSRLFSKFDEVTVENKVQKIQIIGTRYIVMGYNGKVDIPKRDPVLEANRIMGCAFEMLRAVNEVNMKYFQASPMQQHKPMKALDPRSFKRGSSSESISNSLTEKMRVDVTIGVHSGPAIGGIIGSKIMHYEILGEAVYIANKMEANGQPFRVCISGETKKLLSREEESDYEF